MSPDKNLSLLRNVLENEHLSKVFFAIANDVSFPTEIAEKIGKTKYTISMQLSQLKTSGFIKKQGLPDDLRKKRYVVNWPIFAHIFYTDHRLEFELYENNLFILRKNIPSEITAKILKAELVRTGDGKLGLLMDLYPEDELRNKFGSKDDVEKKINRILTEFIELLKVYVTKRAFLTIQQCLLTLYKELKDNCKLDKKSELMSFFDFVNGYFSEILPFKEIWEEHSNRKSKEEKIYFKNFESEKVIKQFLDAGWIDYTGEYILDREVTKSFLKPGARIVLYPSYTYRGLKMLQKKIGTPKTQNLGCATPRKLRRENQSLNRKLLPTEVEANEKYAKNRK